jgi:glycosyltransferase involved in cell wall biosynthesis
MSSTKKIAAFHLLNDYSGSPLVFAQALKALQESGHEVILHTSNPDTGFLANVDARKIKTPYRFYSNALLRLIAFFYSQFITFFQVLRYHKKDTVIYVNTLLPFGAALAGKLTGKKVVYHLHETSIRPLILLRFLQNIAAFTASQAIYVSKYLYNELPLKGVDSQIIYNALPADFEKQVNAVSDKNNSGNFTVLMVCSLKRYKGIFEFVELAQRHPSLNFEMVINAQPEEIESAFPTATIPSNLKLFPVQKNLHPFYQRASLVVNLTNPALCVETFGMTLLEAMCYGIPVIAPPVGGPAEIVQNGENGYTADVRDTSHMDQLLQSLAQQESEMIRLSANAKATSKRFSADALSSGIQKLFQ